MCWNCDKSAGVKGRTCLLKGLSLSVYLKGRGDSDVPKLAEEPIFDCDEFNWQIKK